MKKYILMTVVYIHPSPEILQEWMNCFAFTGDRMIDQMGLGSEKTVSPESTNDLPIDENAIPGMFTT